ncbi:MAG: EAL domain-containing protein [Maledivibacter sp.]|jgi:diguanylate cyclase (GGDEF)-like protein|nr:EAL domain-containing protein [Maledivibacter sp.]
MRNKSGEAITLNRKKINLRHTTDFVPGYMKLHKKFIIIFGIITIATIGVGYIVTNTMGQDNLKDIDHLSIKYFMILILLIGCIYFTAAWFFMNKYIFNRLESLMISVNEISRNKDLSTRICTTPKDEISTLESEFNIMLDALQESQNKLMHQSQHDDLTNLPNRTYFYQQAKRLLNRAKYEGHLAAVLFFDIDKFKGINDSLGHEIGDYVLRIVTKRLKENISSNNIISRIGGDEFIIFLSNIKIIKEIEEIIQKIIDTIKVPIFSNDKQIFITSSIGISLYPCHGDDIEALINNADIAMNRVKKEGKNGFKFYTRDMRNRISVDMLRSTLQNGELELYYQSKVNADIGQIEGMEALLRWKNPKYGMISPMEFIPLAEETGLIIPIGEWVLKRACMQNKKWQDTGYRPMRVAVNISSIQFMQSDFIPMVKDVLKETKLEGSYLELEITESVALNKEEEVIDKLLILRDIGIHISIDDFGTGYSSLSYLERLPVDSLKIDREFIKNIGNDSTVVKMIIGMAKSLELSVVAEGVETNEQSNYLMQFGCKSMQGYLFSKPLPTEKFEKLLLEENR